MSRKIIRDFIKQADKLDNEQAAGYFDKIIEVYEDSVHTAGERVATLESDTLWLLIEYRRNVKAIDNTPEPEERQQHRIAQFNLWQLLSTLIASTADKGIYLSEAFIKKYEYVDVIGFTFGQYVRDTYKVRKWQSPEPQKTAPESPQQPNEGNNGELAGNSNETPPEGNTEDTGGNNEGNKYIELPTSLQTTDERAEKIFTAAYNDGWIKKKESGGYEWVGFGKHNKKGEIIAHEMKLAYLCAQTYGYYKTGYYHDPEGTNSPPWNELSTFFKVWYTTPEYEKKDLSYYIAKVDRTDEPQRWRKAIDNLIKTAIK